MPPAVQAAIISALALIVIALAGLVWRMFERIVKIEVLVSVNKEKIKEVDDRRHRYQVEQHHRYDDLRNHIDTTLIGASKK